MTGARTQVEFRWKEEVIYWEGDVGFIFDGGWGVTPSVTYIPDAETWDAVVPAWMAGRRNETDRRLALESGHVLQQTPDYQPPAWRDVTR